MASRAEATASTSGTAGGAGGLHGGADGALRRGGAAPGGAGEFDAVEFINKLFPTENSLGALDKYIGALKRKIKALDDDILGAVRQQSSSQARACADLDRAKSLVSTLFSRISEIQRKSEVTEAMVQEICRDIKKLDHAKTHLTAAITSLRRLAMLTNAVAQLEASVSNRAGYGSAASLLEAVTQLFAHFDQFSRVPRVAQLEGQLSSIQAALSSHISRDFEELWRDHDPCGDGGTADARRDAIDEAAPTFKRLADACAVADALGQTERERLVAYVCNRELRLFNAIKPFERAEHRNLGSMKSKYKWFKDRVDNEFLKRQMQVFPEKWFVQERVVIAFCKQVKAQLQESLSSTVADNALDLNVLLPLVKETHRFEAALNATCGVKDADDEAAQPGGAEWSDQMSATQARKRLEEKLKQERLAASGQADVDAEIAAQVAAHNFEGSISSAFEDYLGPYIKQEEKELMSKMAELVAEEGRRGWAPTEEDAQQAILPSANDLLLHFKSIAARCKSVVSAGRAFVELSKVFGRVSRAYLEALVNRLPATASGKRKVQPPFHGNDWCIVMPDKDIAVACRIIQTAEFLEGRMAQLQTMFETQTKPPLNQEISFENETAFCMQVAATGLMVLVAGINTRLDGALADMTRMRWDAIESVGDQSPWVTKVQGVLADCIPPLAKHLVKHDLLSDTDDHLDLMMLCNRTVQGFIPRFLEALHRCRRVSESGSQQLLLDTQEIRKALLNVPQVAKLSEQHAGNYVQYVTREMSVAEALVKVIATPKDRIIDTYCALMPEASQNSVDFARVLELTAIKKPEAQALVQQYTATAKGSGPGEVGGLPGGRPEAMHGATGVSSLGAGAGSAKSLALSGLSSMGAVGSELFSGAKMSSVNSRMKDGLNATKSMGQYLKSKLNYSTSREGN